MFCSTLRCSTRMRSDMLKPRLIAAELLKKRLEERGKKQSAPLNSADITILGDTSTGFGPSIILNTEGNSFMFNCASGLQRFCFTSKIRLHRLENVFVTNRTWENISGLFGLSLTLQDMGSPKLNVVSTKGIGDMFEASRHFMFFNTGMVCSAQEATEYKDHSITIKPIAIDSCVRKSAMLEGQDGESSDGDETKRAKISPKVLTYLCTLPDLPGALDPLKCKELKVPIGPLLGRLKSGADVTLADGRTVRSEEVCSPRVRGSSFVIIDCPDSDHLSSMITNEQLNKARDLRDHHDGHQIDFLIHLSPPEIVQRSEYQRWMQGFPDSCKHFLASNADPQVAHFIECYRFQYMMNKLDDKLFPLLYLPVNLRKRCDIETTNPNIDPDLEIVDKIDNGMEPALKLIGELNQLDRVTKLNSLDKISVRPKKILETLELENNLDILHKEAQLNPHYREELEKLKKLQSCLPEAKEYEPELVFLGTGSAIPSKLRNTSCILLNFKYPRNASVLMDCGEDSHNQIFRHYGPTEAAKILAQLDLIYVSHHHTDHHVGLIDILRQRRKYTNKRVTLILPPSLDNLIKFHDENFQDLRGTYKIYRSKHIKSKPMMGPDIPTTASIKRTIYDDLEGLLDKIDLVDVDHCTNSCAVVFHFNLNHPEMQRFTVAYSGDARPSKDFIVIGKDCDLLIHEATFDDRSREDAIVKKHSTSQEAIEVGREMGAKFTILTHFSQRLPKIPYFTESFDSKVGFAFDHLTVSCPSHFCRLPILKPTLGTIFKKALEEIDLKYLKSELRSRALSEALKSK